MNGTARGKGSNEMAVVEALDAMKDELAEIRRDIHAHPELGFEEHRTSAIVAEKLRNWGIETHTGLAKTGVVGVIRGKGNGPGSIGLRADLDALPMQEISSPPHKSVHDGVMHACGHDGHTTMLLGAARYLAETRNFDGTVNVIFQPAEENAGGGRVMVEEGLFDRFPCDAVYGMHNYTGIPAGTFGIRPGGLLAASDELSIEIEGIGGHAAWPHSCVNPIVVGAQMIAALQAVVSQSVAPTRAAVLSITVFDAGTVVNVIPGRASIKGSIRTLDEETRGLVSRRVEEICHATAAAHGARVSVAIARGYPPVVNHAKETARAVRAAARTVGDANVDRDMTPLMGSEDFSYMLQARPGAFIMLGQGDETCVHALHHPEYDFNDKVLPIGASYWVHLVEQELPLSGG